MFGFGGGQSAALNAANQANSTGAGYGSQASNISAQLLPFFTRELNNPQGFTQQQTGSMIGAAEGGAGGATAGLTTEANLASARDRNSGGFSGALDEAARQKDKALAGTSEGIATKSADLAQQHQQTAASDLTNVQGMDQNAQLKAMGLEAPDINASTQAGEAGWNAMGSLVKDASGVAGLAGGFGIPGFQGFRPGG
jgi:hypothetical protein